MFGLEETRQQAIDPQQPLPRQRHAVVAGREHSLAGERLKLIAKLRQNIGAVFGGEVRRADDAKLELEHELADQGTGRFEQVMNQ